MERNGQRVNVFYPLVALPQLTPQEPAVDVADAAPASVQNTLQESFSHLESQRGPAPRRALGDFRNSQECTVKLTCKRGDPCFFY